MYPFIGTEALAAGELTRGQLRWNYEALHPNVYLGKDQRQTLDTSAYAAWLWSGRKGIVAGLAAARLHGVASFGNPSSIELIAGHARARPGIVVRAERIGDDEVTTYGSLRVTTPAPTALDMARHLPRDTAVQYLDELARKTPLTRAETADLLDRYRGAPGTAQARTALSLMDGGSKSPRETRLRLLLVDCGVPTPRTDIVIGDERGTAVIAMGWEKAKVGVRVWNGNGHDARFAVQNTRRQDVVNRMGWFEVEVADGDRTPAIRWRVRDALRQRGAWRMG